MKAAIAGGAELSQGKADRTDDRPERFLAAVVGEIKARPGDLETADENRPRRFRDRRLRRQRRGFGEQIGKIECAILVDQHMRVKTIERDRAENPFAHQRRDRIEIYIETLPAEE